MNQLDKLIQELCPYGVKFKPIKEEYQRLKGTPITAAKMKEIEALDGDIRIFAGGKTVIDAYEKDIPKANIIRVPAVVVQSRGVIDAVYYEKPFTFKNEMWAYTHKNKIAVKFLYYVLKNNIGKFRDAASGMGSLPQISLRVTEDFEMPVPPMEVQQEIVRVLDQFTELTAELNTKLTEELTARKKQYEHYRDELLTFADDVPLVTLGDVAVVTKLAGFEFTKYVRYADSGKIIALRGLNVKNGKLDLTDVKYIDNSDFPKLTRSKLHIGDMLFTYVGTIGQVALIDKEEKYYLAPNVALIRSVDDRLSPQYMRYYFQSRNFWKTQINKLLQSSSMQNIPMEKIRKFAIPLPSLEEQHRIVSILDRFDTLCNDLTNGLPAEIEARQKQYEYYRDKLLTFERSGSASNE